MIVLSLFDGISCGQQALKELGIDINMYLSSEIDENAIKVTQFNHPDTIQIGDVRLLSSNTLPKIDLLIGGSPCQGFSFAGKQLNFEDERSMLFFEYVRLLKECNPKYFLLENVKMKQEYEDIISEFLGVKPIKINSALVSGQLRSRLYWTNIPNIKQPEDKGIKLDDIIESGYVDRDKSLCLLEGYSRPNTNIEKLYRRYKDKSFMQIVYMDAPMSGKNIRVLTQMEMERLQTLPVGYTQVLKRNDAASCLGNGWTVEVIKHIFKNMEI